jgi:hypothetical protein
MKAKAKPRAAVLSREQVEAAQRALNRGERMTVRLTTTEARAVETAAASVGEKVPVFVRRALASAVTSTRQGELFPVAAKGKRT